MIETALMNGASQSAVADITAKKNTLQKQNGRMAGTIYDQEVTPQSAREEVTHALSQATHGKTENFSQAMGHAYAPTPDVTSVTEETFGFGDIIDMANPLHHLPLVGMAYRELTGDDIKPISSIIGGAVYGGGVGAASSVANVIIEHETGKDISGNAMSYMRTGDAPLLHTKAPAYSKNNPDHPEARLNEAALQSDAARSLPGSVLGFTDLGYGKREVYRTVPSAEGRTAGSDIRHTTEVRAPRATPREPISQVVLNR